MGERGKNDEMKNHKTNLDAAIEPELEKPVPRDSAGKPSKPEVRLGKEAQARIGEQLRTMYNSFVNQGVPDHLADLVRRLSEQE